MQDAFRFSIASIGRQAHPGVFLAHILRSLANQKTPTHIYILYDKILLLFIRNK